MINPKTGLLAAGFAALAVAAVAGWARKPAGASAPVSYGAPAQASYYDQNAQPVYGASQAASVNQPCVPASGNVASAGYQPVVYSTPYQDDRYVSDHYMRSIHRPVRVVSRNNDGSRENYVHDSGPVYVQREVAPMHEGRSKKKSVAIVAGSAAGGAAVGALAGGGKGAGIGALAGGGAGFIYDRLTHNHR